MPKFDYKAIESSGKVKSGQINLKTKKDVVNYLTNQGFTPVKIKEHKKLNLFKFKNKRVWLLNFTEYLANLLGSKIELLKSLYIIADSYDDSDSVELIHRLADKIKKGASFSEALSEEPIFDELYVTLVKVGEEGGNLAFTVKKLYEHLQNKNETYNFLISSMIYPAVLLSTTLLSAFILLVYVLPKFGQIFDELQQEIPTFTKFLISFGIFLKNYSFILAIILIILFILIKKSKTIGQKFSMFMFKLPVLGDLLFSLDVKNFFQSMSILLYGGHPFLYAFSLSKKVIKQPDLQQSLTRMMNQIKQGKQFSQLLKAEGIFPSDVVNLVAISEETGQAAELYNNISNQLDKKNKQKITKFLNMLEPLTIIILGLFVGAIVMSMLSAIFGINDVQF